MKESDVSDKRFLKQEFLNQITNLTYLLPTRIDQIEVNNK